MKSRRLLAGLCAALIPFTAVAVPVTYQFSGQVALGEVPPPPEGQPPVTMFPFGTEFTGSFTYENETPVSIQAPGQLIYYGAVTGASISFGPGGALGEFGFAAKPYAASTTQSSMIFFANDYDLDGTPYDEFDFDLAIGSVAGDPANMFRYLGFSSLDYSGQKLPAGQTLLDPLPVDALIVGFHQLNFGYTLYGDDGQPIERASVGSQQITLSQVRTSVPEPATLALLIVGLAGIGVASRRRVRQPRRSAR